MGDGEEDGEWGGGLSRTPTVSWAGLMLKQSKRGLEEKSRGDS